MTLKELADYWAKRFEGPDWETVDELYSAIHQMVGMDCELAAKTDPSHLVMAALTVVTFWCDYLAQQQAALEKNIAPAAEHIGV